MKRKFWIVNVTDAGVAQIYLYGYIGLSDDMQTSDLCMQIRQLCSLYDDVQLRINSGGGSVLDGIAIRQAIKENIDKLSCYIDGCAASMAAILALVFPKEKLYINKYGRLMTHKVQGGAFGTADDLRTQADLIDSLEGDLSDMLSTRTGLSTEAATAKYITDQDRWLTADQCIAEGLCGGTYDGDVVTIADNITNAEQLVNLYGIVLNKVSIHEDSILYII